MKPNTADQVAAEFETLLTAPELSKIIGFKVQTLAQQRMQGRGLPYIRIGSAIRYKLSEVEAFIEANTVRPLRD